MRYARLTALRGNDLAEEAVWINPDYVIAIEPTLQGDDRSYLVLAHYPLAQRLLVVGKPDRVAAALSDAKWAAP